MMLVVVLSMPEHPASNIVARKGKLRGWQMLWKEAQAMRVFLAIWFVIGCTAGASGAGAADPSLVIQTQNASVTMKLSTLLARPDVETVVIDDDVSYSRRMTYRALKIAAILANHDISEDATLEIVATDGFTSSVPFSELRNTSPSRSVAYLALEEPRNAWPLLEGKQQSAGPFYVVWKNPHISNISREQWPYRVARVVVKGSIDRLYPSIQPAADSDDNVEVGYSVFVKNCLPCHTLNGSGPSHVGPDLNFPMNPTEYFHEGILRQFIRNPQSVRLNRNNPMPPFPDNVLSDSYLDALLAYLHHMVSRKVATTRP